MFVYNRFEHTQKTIEALQKNELASESELIIYADGAKNDDISSQVQEVRDYIKTVNGFKKVIIIEQDENCGLADSIISGVTKVANEYGKVIVLEDDVVTSPYFLKFMNDALNFYENKEKVWHISGWNYPIGIDGPDDVFLWRLMNCWGWATWADRWQHFEKDTDKLIGEFTKEDIYQFNLDGVGIFWEQVLLNKRSKINTWAIYWYATIFKKNGLCANSSKSFVENIGHDGSGMHCGENNSYSGYLCLKKDIEFSDHIKESRAAIREVKKFYRFQKGYRLSRMIGKLLKLFKSTLDVKESK